ncbi:MAG: hypothetical protein ACRC06_12145 [Waterburya sp.]
MVRDASHQQVIQKFSFIESLNLSRGISQDDQKSLNQINTERLVNSSSQATAKFSVANLATSVKQEPKSNALVTTAEATSTINTSWYESDSSNYNLNLAEIIKYSAIENPSDNNTFRNRNYLGKILFALACSYCLFVLWWLFGHQFSKLVTTLTGGQQITLSKSDVEFIDYMERSLDNLERQANKDNGDREEKVVYVPVYTPTPATPNLPQISSNNLPPTTIPTTPEPLTVEPTPASSEVLKIPEPPPLPAPTPLAPATTPQESQPETVATATTTAKPAVKHTLLGILDLGENKSAALVKVNDQTIRIWVGEEINHSGWILDSVADQTAKISYQGQIRSIAVGETFE